MLDLIWDIHQQNRINQTRDQVDRAQGDIRDSTERIRNLESSLHRVALASQAMWELLQSKCGLTEEELRSRMQEIDLRDGKQDQRMTPTLTNCPGCNRPMNSKYARCIYCGADAPNPNAFQ